MENYYFIGPTDLDVRLGTLKMVENFVASTEYICFDTETTGLCPHTSDIVMVQIGDKNIQFVIDVRHVDISHIIEKLVSKKIIGANLSFDYKMVLSKYGVRLQNLQDIRIREMVLECGRQKKGFSLQAITEKYCGVKLEKDVRNEFALLGNKFFTERQILYGARDVIYPQLIYAKQQARILEDELSKVIHLEQEFVRVLAEMEYNGMYVDPKRWLELYDENQKQYLAAEQALNDYLIDNNITRFLGSLDLFTNKPSVNINWSSNAQVVPVFKHLGIPTEVLDKEKTIEAKDKYGLDIEIFKDSVGRVEVSKYEKEFPFVALYLKYKKYEKAVTTYGSKWIQENVNPRTKRVHSSFYQILNTGRISSSGPNVQQIPSFKSKDKLSCEAHRTCFIAPEGRKLIVRDFSACELRILADYSSEESMKNEFIYGTGDLHSLTASKVYTEIEGKPIVVSGTENKHLRHVGKTLNFALSYGASAFKIASSLGVSKDEGQKIVDSFYSAFPNLKNYFKFWHEFVKENGYVLIDNYTKRRSYFPFFEDYQKILQDLDLYQSSKYMAKTLGQPEPAFPKALYRDLMIMRGSMERAAQNFRIQGTNASMTKIAMIMMYNWIRDNNLFNKISIVLSLHDEIVIEADEDIAELADEKLKAFMIYSGTLFCPNIPMVTDGGICSVWDH